ncbi:dickkopf-related protein 4-like isoform X2 [Solea solea]|uniref:dickkopf-related protein 4-like isoform X2 n=1 Tax=Solea solea TaxID=90069 RepID=UPI00272D976F|nr:dickkopf-related protein 4-like isoform X2 [Solea solea]
MWMWMWRSVLCVSLVCGLALDSNTIRSSERQVEREAHRQTEKAGCSNRAQRRQSSQDRQLDGQRHRDTEFNRQKDTDSFNRTKGPEMSSCVRSGDCAAGLCCARYLTGKRCQRIPVEGEACLLRGSTKLRRNLGRCNCDTGMSCISESSKNKGQGVCLPRPRQGQRKTRHSGKKRRTAERSC